MTNTHTPLDPIAQLVAKYQSDGHQIVPAQQSPALQARQKKRGTGFADKTLWDWLNLLGVFLVPIVIPAALFWLSVQQNLTSLEVSNRQHQSDQAIALDQQRATTLKAYTDDMTELLLHEGLRDSKEDATVRVIATTKTLVALSQLNGARKGTLIRFLYEAQIIGSIPIGTNAHISRIISLFSADLNQADLSRLFLIGVDLTGADLTGADLNGSNLSNASMEHTNLIGAFLREANLNRIDLIGADLSQANLSRVALVKGGLSGANLTETNLSHADLREAFLRETNLSGADLSAANLKGAEVTPEQLAEAYSLEGTILPDGSLYPSSSYPIPHHQGN